MLVEFLGSRCKLFVEKFWEIFEFDINSSASLQKKQSVLDHFLLFVLFTIGTPDQKKKVLFFILTIFSPAKTKDRVHLRSAKDMLHRLHLFLMVPLPLHEVSASIDQMRGEFPTISKAEVILSSGVQSQPQTTDAEGPGGPNRGKLQSMASESVLDVSDVFRQMAIANHNASLSSDLIFTDQFISKLILEKSIEFAQKLERGKEALFLSLSVSYKSKKQKNFEIFLNKQEIRRHFFDSSCSWPHEIIEKAQGTKEIMRGFGFHIVKLQDSHEMVDFDEFCFIIDRLPVLNWALSASPHHHFVGGFNEKPIDFLRTFYISELQEEISPSAQRGMGKIKGKIIVLREENPDQSNSEERKEEADAPEGLKVHIGSKLSQIAKEFAGKTKMKLKGNGIGSYEMLYGFDEKGGAKRNVDPKTSLVSLLLQEMKKASKVPLQLFVVFNK